MEKLLNIDDVAQFLSVKVSTIYGWIHEGYIPYLKIGRLVRFERKELILWLKKKHRQGRTTHRIEREFG